MNVAIIDYGSGNLRSCAKAFEAAGANVIVSADPRHIANASHIVLPGVGSYGDCMRGLQAAKGVIECLSEQVLHIKKPFLGICVCMQMLLSQGHEHGVHQGLGWIPGKVVRLTPADPDLKIPHMGWNELNSQTPQPLLAGITNGDHAYFVHSYHAICASPSHMLATVDYGNAIAAVVGDGNIVGTQFHPEKSQTTGFKIISNFLKMT